MTGILIDGDNPPPELKKQYRNALERIKELMEETNGLAHALDMQAEENTKLHHRIAILENEQQSQEPIFSTYSEEREKLMILLAAADNLARGFWTWQEEDGRGLPITLVLSKLGTFRALSDMVISARNASTIRIRSNELLYGMLATIGDYIPLSSIQKWNDDDYQEVNDWALEIMLGGTERRKPEILLKKTELSAGEGTLDPGWDKEEEEYYNGD